jgi:hypothetical protein
MLRTPSSLVVVTIGLCLALGQAHGAPETHDGFYLRMHAGFGSNSAVSDADSEVTLEGGGAAGGLSLGYMIFENTGLFFEFSSASMIGPEIKQDGMVDQASDDIEVGVYGSGIGVIHYFMPVNIYVSAALVSDELGVTLINFDGAGNDLVVATSELGTGLNLMVGKEWWVSENWGLGVAGALRSSTMKDGADEWTVNSFNLVFSATYN